MHPTTYFTPELKEDFFCFQFSAEFPEIFLKFLQIPQNFGSPLFFASKIPENFQ
jgi:hypothetical protein